MNKFKQYLFSFALIKIGKSFIHQSKIKWKRQNKKNSKPLVNHTVCHKKIAKEIHSGTHRMKNDYLQIIL